MLKAPKGARGWHSWSRTGASRWHRLLGFLRDGTRVRITEWLCRRAAKRREGALAAARSEPAQAPGDAQAGSVGRQPALQTRSSSVKGTLQLSLYKRSSAGSCSSYDKNCSFFFFFFLTRGELACLLSGVAECKASPSASRPAYLVVLKRGLPAPCGAGKLIPLVLAGMPGIPPPPWHPYLLGEPQHCARPLW